MKKLDVNEGEIDVMTKETLARIFGRKHFFNLLWINNLNSSQNEKYQ
jgi:hypothetical protein